MDGSGHPCGRWRMASAVAFLAIVEIITSLYYGYVFSYGRGEYHWTLTEYLREGGWRYRSFGSIPIDAAILSSPVLLAVLTRRPIVRWALVAWLGVTITLMAGLWPPHIPTYVEQMGYTACVIGTLVASALGLARLVLRLRPKLRRRT